MFGVETARLDGMIVCDGEVTESVCCDEFVELAQRVFNARQFSNAVFGRYFSYACIADKHSVGFVSNGCCGPFGQARIVLPPPQQCVNVEQEAH